MTPQGSSGVFQQTLARQFFVDFAPAKKLPHQKSIVQVFFPIQKQSEQKRKDHDGGPDGRHAQPGDERIKDHGDDGHQRRGFVQIQTKQQKWKEYASKNWPKVSF